MKHRREIDGLRTVAVLPVLLSHAGVSLFAGGFVGVDVFFVISGYLITGIILSELDNGRFSIVRFYERRTRRLLPALFVVLVACLIAGWFLMSADAYQNLGQSIVATTLFSNNILLTVTSGYWDMESQFKPLLHTWSLGVEEQYYIVVPLLLAAVHRFLRRHVPLALALVGLASFLLCLWSMRAHPVGNFYLLHTRAWELAAGGWAATIRSPDAGRGSDPLALTGLLMIAAAVLGLPEGSPSPAPAILLPVTGTVFVLLYCRAGLAHRFLSSPMMVGIGLISYSTYLWHQPLFAFLRVASISPPPTWQFVALIPVALILAWASWRFVEQPFRDRSMRFRAVAAVLLPTAIALLAIGTVLHLRGGLPQRFDMAPGADRPATFKAYNMGVLALKADRFPPGTQRRALVLGNSTGRDFVNMAREANALAGYAIVYRDDLDLCDGARLSATKRALVAAATLIVLVYDHKPRQTCNGRLLAERADLRAKILFVGPKDFGTNLNPFARLPLHQRAAARVALSDQALAASRLYRAITPAELYLDVIAALSADGRRLPVFDEQGRILSEDRVHVTRAGARFVGERLFRQPVWRQMIARRALDRD
ncbi:Peptidoglycan/LPS O-acetylase OafA/YrhL, contains acyltransferase and SGNH-hydrolase domains [Sphingomonas sp. OV641]|uniref:acyltransferase family protein n=1 Tax=Sphingomonas sp. OV641 TaxID=1881068 RepID=UPI0008BD241A|nr:acyltransferase [Sphingomonas sp. OV641]SEJ61001.1 Peptidoglycan/LPS O-acetylase OafA/YrhL, contains acyltransferase and SGNH-hydrolase domains [Sphingomonas sp. OV641]